MIENYDFDKDGKLNMAEYKQYVTENEEEGTSPENDDVVFLQTWNKIV